MRVFLLVFALLLAACGFSPGSAQRTDGPPPPTQLNDAGLVLPPCNNLEDIGDWMVDGAGFQPLPADACGKHSAEMLFARGFVPTIASTQLISPVRRQQLIVWSQGNAQCAQIGAGIQTTTDFRTAYADVTGIPSMMHVEADIPSDAKAKLLISLTGTDGCQAQVLGVRFTEVAGP